MDQSDKDQGVSDSVGGLKEPVSMSSEVSIVKEQTPEHSYLIKHPTSRDAISRGSEASVSGEKGKA